MRFYQEAGLWPVSEADGESEAAAGDADADEPETDKAEADKAEAATSSDS